MKGYFVSIEGSEGAGKTTQRENIAGWLKSRGIEVVLTREPGGTPLAERVRELLLTPSDEVMDNTTELLLVYAARVQHVERVIKPAIERGAIVLCDRFVDSTYAYQGFGRGFPIDKLDAIRAFAMGDFKPDLTFYFTLPIEVGMARASSRGKLDRFEQEELSFFNKVAEGFRWCRDREPERYITIDGNMSVNAVFAQIEPHLEKIEREIKTKRLIFG